MRYALLLLLSACASSPHWDGTFTDLDIEEQVNTVILLQQQRADETTCEHRESFRVQVDGGGIGYQCQRCGKTISAYDARR